MPNAASWGEGAAISMLVGSEPPQGLEALSEVVGVEEGFEVLSELRVGLVVIAPNGGFLEGAVHPLDLTVGSVAVSNTARSAHRRCRNGECNWSRAVARTMT